MAPRPLYSLTLPTLLLALGGIMIIRLISEEGGGFMNQGRLSPNKLAANVEIARPILIQKAKEGGLITYKDLLTLMGGHPGRGYIGEVLNRIAELERETGHPKLTAVVVRVDTGTVGGGFFGLPHTPSNLLRTSHEEWQNPRLSAADRDYWQRQLTLLYQYWQSHSP